ncbi:GGDEF domain-containing protein [Achromobacter deleyi]|uniref:GGDEF domain-containing protein n=1 Tax=Achromobacter deleyi TaxID=1353891 RepID=UPI001491C5AF|nr:GGDEF domain-containing protein [Achromobacter deleyi]QVQ28309.1 GGDEF domain-containing protein [Achromobacter deleyi]
MEHTLKTPSNGLGNKAPSAGEARNHASGSLVKKFIAYSALILISLFIVVYFCVSATWNSYINKEQTRRSLRIIGAGLSTIEMLMRESALTLAALEKKEHDSPGQQLARTATDSAIAHFKGLLSSSRCTSCLDDEKKIKEMVFSLSAVRDEADFYQGTPGNPEIGRQLISIDRGVARLTPEMRIIVANQSSAAWRTEIDLGGELALLAFTGDLYESTEQLGSSVLPALAQRRRLSATEHAHSQRALARIEEALELIEMAMLRRTGPHHLAESSVTSRIFADNLEYVGSLLAKPDESAKTDIGAVEIYMRYATSISGIARFQDELLRDSLAKVDEHEALLEIQFILAALAVIALSLSLIWGLLGFWKRIIHPFGVANRIIRSFILEDAAIQFPPLGRYRGVTGEFFSTLSSLKEHIDFKRDLEIKRNALIEVLHKLAETDHLTGLLNRRAFERQVAECIEEWNDSGKLLAFILFDVDHFKDVNDRYGHIAGDTALATIAEICRQNCRNTEIMARVGGEEFCVVCFVSSPLEADAIAHRLRLTIQNSKIVYESGCCFHITASFGVAVSRFHEECNTSVLFAKADRLLYLAKAYGRNRVILSNGEETV